MALAVGRLLPEVAKLPRAPFVALGAGYGVLGVAFVVVGALRQRDNEQAMGEGRFARLQRGLVVALTVYLTVLIVVSISALFWGR